MSNFRTALQEGCALTKVWIKAMTSITNLESLNSEKTGEKEFVSLKRSLRKVGILNMLQIAAEKRLHFSPSQM